MNATPNAGRHSDDIYWIRLCIHIYFGINKNIIARFRLFSEFLPFECYHGYNCDSNECTQRVFNISMKTNNKTPDAFSMRHTSLESRLFEWNSVTVSITSVIAGNFWPRIRLFMPWKYVCHFDTKYHFSTFVLTSIMDPVVVCSCGYRFSAEHSTFGRDGIEKPL